MRTLVTLSDGSSVVTDIKQVQNRTVKDEVRAREDLRRWMTAHPPEERRDAHPVLLCPRCQNSKRTDGTDKLGGFSPNGSRTNGWSYLCRWCAKTVAKERRCNSSTNQS